MRNYAKTTTVTIRCHAILAGSSMHAPPPEQRKADRFSLILWAQHDGVQQNKQLQRGRLISSKL
jgi:hypothetical protein